MGWLDVVAGLFRRPAPVVVPPPPVPVGTLTVDALLMGRDNDQRYAPELTPVVLANLAELARRVNLLLGRYGSTPTVNSGWRPRAINRAVGGRPGSAHLTGQAVDLADADGRLKAWLEANIYELDRADLYLELPAETPRWTHLQTRRASSRIFKP